MIVSLATVSSGVGRETPSRRSGFIARMVRSASDASEWLFNGNEGVRTGAMNVM